MASHLRPLASKMPTELPALVQVGEVRPAMDLFRGLLGGPFIEPELTRWINEGCRAYDGNGGTDDMTAARQDGTAANLLLARILFGHRHGSAAVAVAREAMRAEPARPEPCFLLCVLQLKSRDPEAHHLLRRCLAAFPQQQAGWTDIGQVLLALGQKEAALVCLARGEPSFALTMQQGLVARDLGRPDQARTYFAAAATIDPGSPRAWFLLGTCAQDAGDLIAAQTAYRTVLTLDPTRAEAAVNLGTVLQESGDLDGAKAAYGQAVKSRADTFGRVAQALATSPKGELWLDLAVLRHALTR